MSNLSDEFNEHEYTYKSYYYPEMEDEENLQCMKNEPVKRSIKTATDIDAFFDQPKSKKKKKNLSSTVGQGCKGGGISYISTNVDNITDSTHLIKMEIYDLKKIAKVPDNEQWKHADVRIKYYTNNETNKNMQQTKNLIFNITKEIAESEDYEFNEHEYTYKNYYYPEMDDEDNLQCMKNLPAKRPINLRFKENC